MITTIKSSAEAGEIQAYPFPVQEVQYRFSLPISVTTFCKEQGIPMVAVRGETAGDLREAIESICKRGTAHPDQDFQAAQFEDSDTSFHRATENGCDVDLSHKLGHNNIYGIITVFDPDKLYTTARVSPFGQPTKTAFSDIPKNYHRASLSIEGAVEDSILAIFWYQDTMRTP